MTGQCRRISVDGPALFDQQLRWPVAVRLCLVGRQPPRYLRIEVGKKRPEFREANDDLVGVARRARRGWRRFLIARSVWLAGQRAPLSDRGISGLSVSRQIVDGSPDRGDTPH